MPGLMVFLLALRQCDTPVACGAFARVYWDVSRIVFFHLFSFFCTIHI